MEIVSTSNLVSLEKGNTTTSCNFQTMAMKCFVIPHGLIRDQTGSYEPIHSFMMEGVWKSTIRNTHTQNKKIKTNQQ